MKTYKDGNTYINNNFVILNNTYAKLEKEKLIPSVIRYEEYEILIGNAAKVTLEYDDNLENTIYGK